MKFQRITAALLACSLLLPAGALPCRAEAPEGMTLACENDKLRLYYDADTAQIGLENKKNGYVWLSEPPGCAEDPAATGPVIDDLRSTAVLTCGDSNSRGSTVLRSGNAADISVQKQADGIVVTYAFEKCGVTFPVQYLLEDDHLTVRVETAQISESMQEQGIFATQLNLLGSFGAGCPDEEGYFVIPDGCGALIRFHNGKDKTKSYSARVYGRDLTAVPTTKPPVTETVQLPVYGIVRENGNAMTVIADEGSENVTLNATVSGQSLSSYDLCSFNFQLRGSDTYYMAGTYGTLTVFEQGEVKTDAVSLHYYPTYAADADYADIAATYREYLMQEQGVTAKPSEYRMQLDLYGGTMKQRSVFGIPVQRKTAVTSYAQAQEIVSGLHEAGADSLRVVYHNWTDAAVRGKVDDTAKPSATLGGNGKFKQFSQYLEEQGDILSPAFCHQTFRDGGGYSGFLDTAIRISGAYSRQTEYGLAYGTQDNTTPSLSLLSPSRFTKLYQKLAGRCSGRFSAVSLTSSALWGDYGRQHMGRGDTAAVLQDSYKTLTDNGLSLDTAGGAAYSLPYAGHISEMPLQSSGFDIFDAEVPFCQTVLHGLIPYSCTSVNASADTDTAFLTAVAYGCEPAYDMLYAPASELKDTDLDHLFYAQYASWTDTAAKQYQLAKQMLSGLTSQTITGFTREGDSSVTTYADGTAVTVNYADKTITAGGVTCALHPEEAAS